jgi:hypothetical protein
MTSFETIETDVCSIFFEEGIMHIVFKKDSEVELSHINEIIDLRKGIQQGKKMPTVVDIRGLWHVEKDAREKAATNEMIQHNTALAIISGSLGTRLIGNFYMRFDKPDVPTKMFKSTEDAIAWLREIDSTL